MHRFIGRSSTTASSHHDLFSTACITNIADSDFLHATVSGLEADAAGAPRLSNASAQAQTYPD